MPLAHRVLTINYLPMKKTSTTLIVSNALSFVIDSSICWDFYSISCTYVQVNMVRCFVIQKLSVYFMSEMLVRSVDVFIWRREWAKKEIGWKATHGGEGHLGHKRYNQKRNPSHEPRSTIRWTENYLPSTIRIQGDNPKYARCWPDIQINMIIGRKTIGKECHK